MLRKTDASQGDRMQNSFYFSSVQDMLVYDTHTHSTERQWLRLNEKKGIRPDHMKN